MATCVFCDQEMTTAASCTVAVLHRAGTPFPLPEYGREAYYRRGRRPSGRCGDCGVSPGGAHHLGCDLAECPVCRGQLLSCGCRFDEDPPEDEDDGW